MLSSCEEDPQPLIHYPRAVDTDGPWVGKAASNSLSGLFLPEAEVCGKSLS